MIFEGGSGCVAAAMARTKREAEAEAPSFHCVLPECRMLNTEEVDFDSHHLNHLGPPHQ